MVVTAEFRRSAETWQVEGPAVCIPLISSTGHGDAALHRIHYQEGRFALANLLVALLPKNPEVCNAKYLQLLLTSQKDHLLVPLMLGTANVSLKEKDIANVEVALPDLSEQRRVVARVEEVAGLVECGYVLREKLALETAAVVVSLHTSLARGRVARIGDFLELDERVEKVQAHRFYPQVGVRGFGGGLFQKSAVQGSATTYRGFNRLYAGALVLSQVKGWEGAIAVCPPDLDGWFVSPEYRTFRCIEGEASPIYMASLVKSAWFWSRLGSATRGVGARRERTRPDKFLSLEIPMPDLRVQKKAEALLGRLEKLKPITDRAAVEWKAVVPSLLERSFGGGP